MKLQKLLWLASLVSFVGSPAIAQHEDFNLTKEQLFVPCHMAVTSTLHYKDGVFHLVLDSKEHRVARYNVKDFPLDLSAEGLEAFLQSGYFFVGGDETEYTLQWKGRILGGGVLSSLEPKPSPTFPKLENLTEFDEFGKGLGKIIKSKPFLSKQLL